MTENDYIAEYVKERYPLLLGFEFYLWKSIKIISKGLSECVDALHKSTLLDTVEKEEENGD